MSAPTPEAVAEQVVRARFMVATGTCGCWKCVQNAAEPIAAALRAARAAAIEEAARVALKHTSGHGITSYNIATEIAAAIRALGEESAAPPAAVPPGYVVVPNEPTEAMLHAACKALSPGRRPPEWLTVKEKHTLRYKVMVAAAPSQAGEVAAAVVGKDGPSNPPVEHVPVELERLRPEPGDAAEGAPDHRRGSAAAGEEQRQGEGQPHGGCPK